MFEGETEILFSSLTPLDSLEMNQLFTGLELML